MDTNQNHKQDTADAAGNQRSEIPAASAGSPPKPRRRAFTAEFKLAVLKEIDEAAEPGATGLILRKHGLYSAYLTEWRRWRQDLRDADADAARPARRRPGTPRRDHDQLRRENERLKKKVRSQGLLLELQKKLQEAMSSLEDEGSTR